MLAAVSSEDDRERIVEYLRKHVVGPFGGTSELLHDLPSRRYLMGTLFPAQAPIEEMLDEEEVEGPEGALKDEVAEDPVALSNSWMPSSVGLTFFVSGAGDLTCAIWGARYEVVKEGRRQKWQRVPIAERTSPETFLLTAPAGGGRGEDLGALGGRARVTSRWRRLGDGHIVTVALVNAQMSPAKRSGERDLNLEAPLCLHQVGLECRATKGKIVEYPSVDALSHDAEDEELRFLYRRSKVFAIGHGCSADWDEPPAALGSSPVAPAVRSAFMPTFELPALTHGGPPDIDVLRINRLADLDDDDARLFRDLQAFILGYEQWIDGLPARHSDAPLGLADTSRRLLSRLRDTVVALRRGVKTLENPHVLRAFRLANLAMLMQMRHNAQDVAGTRRRRNEGVHWKGDYLSSMVWNWRPFQLAFMLMTIPSIADPKTDDRDVVDLLWFPTGGGKTEAYLAVAALQILLRRMRSGDRGAGTTVITRYTLRLLTAQQFQRSAALVCALELLRRQHEREMGKEAISIGLWVGQEQAPNTFAAARDIVEEMLEQERPINKFQIDRCPWCGTEIVPADKQGDEKAYGVRVGNKSFLLFCPSTECTFHEKLPISVVDEDLYQSPPTFLLATVDKFARLAWVDAAVSFFGGGRHEPPSLIIQDEMHLLSGPLGTTVAVYEGAIETLIEFNGGRPKIIASTATIRNASEQSCGLFGRSVRVFPPPGLAADDSYFAVADTQRRGRLYLGVMAQSHTPQTTMVHTAAALLQAPVELSLTEECRDSYWTLVAYHNSIRELGRTATLARDDIPARIKVIAADESRMRDIDEPDVLELTGNVEGDELGTILGRLSVSATHAESVSMLISTNMLSVGVDIPRLGLMLVNGQPKATAEYIQATSRVGRSSVPGLIVALYNSTKPRDRSHYESFRPYHAALYRHVEPTSVTPFSLPSRERALHAALVILMRHGGGLAANDKAGEFDAKAEVTRRVVAALLARVERVDRPELEAARAHLERLLAEWTDRAEQVRNSGRQLYFRAPTRQHSALLRDFGGVGEGWATLHSMRNVDLQCNVTLMGEER